ncbi:MAG: hypothetical protein IK038_02325 [Bacteroidaceae bacterium]|nr:hypothetical protein [Bacteroidaceae bacterium]
MKKSEANIEDLRNQTVSWGTHRPDDLIPKFMAVLKEYGKEAYDKYVSENPEVEDWKMLDDETKGWVVDELFDLLDGIAPEDCYFGAHPDDGADFGFWSMSNESKKNNESYDWIAFYFCKDKRSGAEYAVIPQDRLFVVGNGGGRYNLSYIDANGHWDRLSYGYFATSCEPISNPENSKVYAAVKADEDRRIIALTESEFDTIADSDDAVKTVKSIVANNYESKQSEKASVICSICGNPTDDPIWGEGNRAFCKDCYGDGADFKHGKTKFVVGMIISLDGVKQYIRELKPRTFVGQSVDTGKEFSLPISSLNRAFVLYDPRNESKKSESLTLKQKELKDMARYGEATDITTISDAEAKELKKKGIETVGISRGVYGMNGALLRDSEGNKYVITARSSNLFYFV